MDIKINTNELEERIVERLMERLKPLLNNSYNAKDDELMDVKGLAMYLKVKESWVYEKVHSKQIPFQKAGRFPRFRKKHIDKWLETTYSSASRAYKPLKRKGEDI